MKNVTVSVDDETYTHARVVAAQRGTSVSRLVRDFLANIDHGAQEPATEWESLWQLIDGEQVEVGETPSRSRTYADARLR
ncbi:DUF6364 family protein [Algiphilus sp. W345]|uniref:DUF6364 family protein n=1 Tax=Banduia mediterranea TaxID=3075609 RepID=A0ABU2WHN9_9GAMM|nr:DUF6364 family protein [Algiphilus sp. W345]MDT0497393.1 DUF6364 family protein [Algiphilus sp. W345]